MDGHTEINKKIILTGPFKGHEINRMKVDIRRTSDGKTILKGDWHGEKASEMHSYIGRNWEKILSDGELK